MFESYLKPPISFSTITGSIVTFNSQYAGLPLKSHTVNIDSVSGVSAINIGSDAKYAGFINFNQLIDVSTLSDNFQWHNENITNNGSNKFTITFSSDETSRCWLMCDLANDFTLVANHKYIILPQFKISNGSLANYKFTFRFQNGNTQIDSIEQIDIQNGSIFIPTQSGNINKLSFYNSGDSTISSSTIITIQILLFDITQMFGSTIADYIYSLGQIKGVAYFRSLFPNDYYDYNAGTLTTVSAVNGSTNSFFTIPIGQTVNEATYNARTGVLEVTQPSVQTIQLPPCPIDTLEGVNNIWADTGDTTLQYIKFG